MSKKPAKTENEKRFPTAEAVGKVRTASTTALHAQALVGRLTLELLNAATSASRANEETQQALAKAALSVGIDPTGTERWDFNDETMSFTKL